MGVSQSLTLSPVSGSQNTANNTSKVQILWTSTQTGESYNSYTKTAKYYVSINNGAEQEYSVSYSLPYQATTTILNATITIPHLADGSARVDVRTWMNTGISVGVIEKSAALIPAKIPRASEITSVSSTTLGNSCNVKWSPKSKDFRYKLKFSIGSWSYTTSAIHPNQTAAYTYTYILPLEIAKQLTNTKTGTLTVTLYTYSDSNAATQIGNADSENIIVTVPDNSSTRPTVTMSLSPVSSLSDTFAGLYIQGKTKVQANITATGKYDATISSKSVNVDGKSYGSSNIYMSEYLQKYGTLNVIGYAKDSRGYTGSLRSEITVIPYSNPKITNVEIYRCNSDGEQSDSGTYLKIKAKREYYKIVSDDIQKNFCKIQYRYKLSSASSYSEWTTILSETELTSDEVNTTALLNGTLSAQSSYIVQVQAVDYIDSSEITTVSIPTDKVYMHRDGARRSLAFGGYVEEDNTFSIADGIQFKVYGEKWIELGLSDEVSETEKLVGHAPDSNCYYRVVNSNHVYVAFICACNYTGNSVIVSSTQIPANLRPLYNVCSLCTVNDRATARVFVNPDGYVCIDWIQSVADTVDTRSYNAVWIDGYVDYFV